MTFISYAQNFEDVLLWRALGHIKRGFYIDVGANDPVEHSVTKAFYDAGWRGINIEPLPSFHQEFLEQRPRDINLALAAGDTDGSLTLFNIPLVNGWASPDRAVAEAHRAEGFEVAELIVPVRTLAGICAEHAADEIHFLKVDVEGFEGEVLRGMDFERWRPWVLVIEATLPNSRVTNHASWEHLVTGHRYHYAHFDGLNRYYVAEEHKELLEVLEIQPNVFDEFISHHLDKAWEARRRADKALVEASARAEQAETGRWEAEIRADDADERADQAHALAHDAIAHANKMIERLEAASAHGATLQQKLDQVNHEHERVQQWARDLEQRLLATLASTSWRVTGPLRTAGAFVRRVRAVPLRAHGSALLRRIAMRVTGSERMRRLLIPVLLRFPRLSKKVSSVLREVKQAPAAPVAPVAQVPDEIRAMPVSARKVLDDLQRARRNAKAT
ncbi:MAG: FkbM family methyltransferase [Telluria sp.]